MLHPPPQTVFKPDVALTVPSISRHRIQEVHRGGSLKKYFIGDHVYSVHIKLCTKNTPPLTPEQATATRSFERWFGSLLQKQKRKQC